MRSAVPRNRICGSRLAAVASFAGGGLAGLVGMYAWNERNVFIVHKELLRQRGMLFLHEKGNFLCWPALNLLVKECIEVEIRRLGTLFISVDSLQQILVVVRRRIFVRVHAGAGRDFRLLCASGDVDRDFIKKLCVLSDVERK